MIFPGVVSAARQASRDIVHALVTVLAVVFCGLVALGFFTAAAFIALSDVVGAAYAAVTVAGFYILAGVVIFLAMRDPGRRRPIPHEQTEALSDSEAIARVVAAFLTGFKAGRG